MDGLIVYPDVAFFDARGLICSFPLGIARLPSLFAPRRLKPHSEPGNHKPILKK